MLLSLALALALAAPNASQRPRFATRDCQRSSAGRSTRGLPCGSALAFFEAANASNTGTGAACACTAVTGAKGEAVTWTRGGSAYCTKEGLATTGLVNTSMVLCGSNLPRVAADGSGVLGWLVESARTNSAIQSEAFDNAAWSKNGVTAAAPIVTADQAVTPWGTTTADRIDFAATGAGEVSIVTQALGTACGSLNCANSFYVKGVSTSGTLDVGSWGAGVVTSPCSYNNSTWTRCAVVANNAGTPGPFIGNTTRDNGGTTRPAQSVFVTGGQGELGAYATSYIATTTLAVARVTDADAVNGATFPGAPFSLSAFVTPEWSSATQPSGLYGIIEGQFGSASGVGLFFSTGGGQGSFTLNTFNVTGASLVSGPNTILAGTVYKVGGANSGGNSTGYFAGTIRAGPTATINAAQPWSTATGIGYAPAGPAPLDGIISRVKIDNTATGGL